MVQCLAEIQRSTEIEVELAGVGYEDGWRLRVLLGFWLDTWVEGLGFRV